MRNQPPGIFPGGLIFGMGNKLNMVFLKEQ